MLNKWRNWPTNLNWWLKLEKLLGVKVKQALESKNDAKNEKRGISQENRESSKKNESQKKRKKKEIQRKEKQGKYVHSWVTYSHRSPSQVTC